MAEIPAPIANRAELVRNEIDNGSGLGWDQLARGHHDINTTLFARTPTGQDFRKQALSGNSASVASLVQDVLKDHGNIDVLHYNAAALHKDTVLSQPIETFNTDLAVNIGGALASIQTVLPPMTRQANGSILLTGGGFGFCPPPDFLSLGIGKAGIRALANGLFEDLKSKGVHIATVTVCKFVDPGSEDAKAVAEHFWTLHSQPKLDWTWEIQHS